MLKIHSFNTSDMEFDYIEYNKEKEKGGDKDYLEIF